MGLALVAGALAACFLNLDKFSSFKGGGFEAQLREAKDTVDQAMVTVENLKNIIRPLLLSTIHNITYTGRWGGHPVNVNEEILQGSKEIIEEFDLYTPELKSAISTYHRYKAWDEYAKMVSLLKEEDCCKQISTEVRDALSTKDCYKNDNFPSSTNVEALIREKGVV